MCRSRHCTGKHGWQCCDYDGPPDLVEGEEVDQVNSVSPKTGRLVFFLAETVHAVRQIEYGDRDVLFTWLRASLPCWVVCQRLETSPWCRTCWKLGQMPQKRKVAEMATAPSAKQ